MILSDAIKSAGYQPPEHIIAGQVTRFSTNGKLSDKAGWVYPFSDGLGAAFGDHRTDEKHHWQADRDQPLSKTEQEKVKQECQIADAERKRQREADYLKQQTKPVLSGRPRHWLMHYILTFSVKALSPILHELILKVIC